MGPWGCGCPARQVAPGHHTLLSTRLWQASRGPGNASPSTYLASKGTSMGLPDPLDPGHTWWQCATPRHPATTAAGDVRSH